MLFKGRLRLPGDAGEGIPIDMTLEDVYLSLDSGGEEFGEWRLDVVEINRLFSNQFSLMLDGEEMVFVASDALGFAYDGISFIEEVQSRLKKRRVFKGRKAKRAKAKKSRPQPEPEPEPAPRSAAPVVDLPMPEVKPFFPEPVASEEPAGEPDVQPVPETPSAPPTVPPVSAAAPTRRNLHPLGDPDEEVVEPYLESPVESVAPPVAAPADPSAGQPPAAQTPADAAPESPPDAVDVEEDDDELVIEDVNPYGYQAPVSMIPEQHARPAPEPTSEAPSSPEPVPPAVVEPEPAPAVQAEPAPSQPAVEPVPEAAPESTPEPASWPFAARDSAPDEGAEAEAEVEVEVEPDARAAEPQTRIPQSSGRHTQDESKSRSSFFGRRKSKEPEPHDHVYESSKTVGGITRSVCSVCGHVSFSGEDVYQNW